MMVRSSSPKSPNHQQIPPMIWIVLLMGLAEMLERSMARLRLKRTIAFVRLDHWARRHGW